MHKLINYDQKTIDSYNNSFDDIMYNIRDFLFLHYMTKKTNTLFWKDVSKLEPPSSLMDKLDIWKNKLPIAEDFNNLSDYILFKESNYMMVMHGLNLFNYDKIKKEYKFIPRFVRDNAEHIIKEQQRIDSVASRLSHKEFIRVVRESL